jgi:hypothetical protein
MLEEFSALNPSMQKAITALIHASQSTVKKEI